MLNNNKNGIILHTLFILLTLALQACSEESVTPSFTVTTNADANGSLSPASRVVSEGGTASFTIIPNDGYTLNTISGCDGTLDGTTYTTAAIFADCTISASFSQIVLSVIFDIGPNGNIAGGGAGREVNWGDSIDIALIPDANYGIDTITGCNGTLNGNTYTAGPITSDCTFSVSFSFVLGSVSPFYNTNGQKWNDYIKNDGASIFTATDAAADGTETGGYSAVLHGGEYRKMQVTGKTNCVGLTATDELGVFEWNCLDTTNPVSMVSRGLQEGRHLSDLIDFDGGVWKKNRVNVYDSGVKYGQSSSETWWSNPVISDNDGSDGSDMTPSDIRIVTIDTTAQYVLTQDKIAMAVKPGLTITSTGTFNPVISSANTKYLWIEGAVDAQGVEPVYKSQIGMNLVAVEFSVVRNLRVENCSSYGVALYTSSNNNFVSDIVVNNCNSGGMGLTASSDNMITALRVTGDAPASQGLNIGSGANNNKISNVSVNVDGTGMRIGDNSGNVFSNIRISQSLYAIDLYPSVGVNTLSGISLFNNNQGIVFNPGAKDYVVSQLTSANNGYSVYARNSASNNVLMQITVGNNSYGILTSISTISAADIQNTTMMSIAASNNYAGVRLSSHYYDTVYYYTKATTLSDYAAMDNDFGIWLDQTPDNFLTGLWKLGNNSTNNCFQFLPPATGGLNDDCTALSPSDFTLTTGATTSNSFVGKLASDDTQNTSDSSGTASYPSSIRGAGWDWARFENIYRGWGKDGSDFPNTDNRDKWSAGTGRIWDWSLKNTDTVLRDVLALPTGNDTLTHTWSDTTQTTFLRSALELLDDGIGNDNGLCESNETCLYTPNIASYQGHGSLVSAGAISNGTLTGITLMKYNVNGR